MARRQIPSRPIGHAQTVGAGAATRAVEPGFELAQDIVARTLEAAHGTLAWAARWQQTGAEALNHWLLALDAARHELARAHDGQALMVLQTELASRQLGLLLEQWGGAWTLLLEDEWRVGERLRNEAVAAAERSATAEPGRPT